MDYLGKTYRSTAGNWYYKVVEFDSFYARSVLVKNLSISSVAQASTSFVERIRSGELIEIEEEVFNRQLKQVGTELLNLVMIT